MEGHAVRGLAVKSMFADSTAASISLLRENSLKASLEITECFGLEGTSKTTYFQSPAICRDASYYSRLLKATFSLALDTAKLGAFRTSLGNLFQCSTTLMGNNFSLMPHLNQAPSIFKLLALIPSLDVFVKSPSSALLEDHFKSWKAAQRSSLLHIEQP